jgi:sec-independent protein translocase protein TatA
MIGDIFQPTHLLLILVVALLVLGPKRLPEAGRSLGRGIRDFRDGLSGKAEPETVPVAQSERSEPKPE